MNDKNKTTAGVLAIIFGGFSIQYFYLGRSEAKKRLLLAIFLPFMSVVFSIQGIIEGIKILKMTEEAFVAYCAEAQGKEAGAAMTLADRNRALLEFKELLDSGAITDEEFATIKNRLMGGTYNG